MTLGHRNRGLAFVVAAATWFATAASAQSITYSTVAAPPAAKTGVVSTDAQRIEAVAVDPFGRRFIVDSARHAILSIYQGVNSADVIAGRNDDPGSADGATLATALFKFPRDIVADAAGNLYLIDGGRIRKIAAADGTVSTFVDIPVDGLSIDGSGNLFVAQSADCTIQKVTPGGVVSLVAGKAGVCGATDGAPEVARFKTPRDVAVGANGILYVLDAGNCTIRAIATDGQVSTAAGVAGECARVDGSGSSARLFSGLALAADAVGTLYVLGNTDVRRMSSAGVVTTLANSVGLLYSIAARGDGIVYVATDNRIIRISATGEVTTLAGTTSGQVDGPAMAARFTLMFGLAFSNDGTLYVSDSHACTIRRLSVQGVVDTVAGVKDRCESRNGASRAVARLNGPSGLAATGDALYVADTGNHAIRRLADRALSTVAGLAGISGTADGVGTAARFNAPRGIAADGARNVYVADTGNHTIRTIASDGRVTTIAGQAGTAGSADGAGAAARFNDPRGVAVDASGTLYVADSGNHTIRAITTSGVVSTVAGFPGSAGNADGSGTAARFSSPSGIAVAADGTLYVVDTGNHTLRSIAPGGVVTTVGGSAGSFGFVDGLAGSARFSSPRGLALDASGTLYVADTGNTAVRMGVSGPATAPVITVNPTARSARPGRSVQFTCAATGNPSPGYIWERSTFPVSLTEGGTYLGVNSSTLTILDVTSDMDGVRFSCRAINSAGSRSSAAAALSIDRLTPSPLTLSFGGVAAPGGGYSSITSPQSVTVGWAGEGRPGWSVSADKSWVQLTNASGAGAGAFTVSVTDPGVGVSQFGSPARATITLTSPDDPGFTIAVNFMGYASNAGPDGSFDTPANNGTGLQGSLPITGWALDKIEMDRVEIWRDAVAGETTPVFTGAGPGNGKIFIANATFVPGARPDVEAFASFYGWVAPRNAGWGYMLLSQGLWNEGNGTFRLYAFAFDKAGAFSTLGAKTITIDNARATKPFGTIDTPNYGGTVSGTFHNFGWALTPGSSCSIANPNVLMSIDSGPLTPVEYGDVRPDVAARFGAYTNGAAAGGHFTIDTTALTNGMHTIGWLVTDSCGRAEGIGSRFFTVANGTSAMTATPAAMTPRAPSREWALTRNGAGADLAIHADGTRVVRMNQSERIEVQLPRDTESVVGALPLGSSFDATTGTLRWQPAAGFLGAYELSFAAGSRVEKLRVVVGPPVRIAIDAPAAGSVLDGNGFTIGGWAADLASLDGAGIDTLHVWAYPRSGVPVFVGVAPPGGGRPDVARLFGASFADAGFTMTGTLAPGTYDLVVFAHSAATDRFEGAQVVRVVVR